MLLPSLAVEETGAKVKVVPYPEFRPRGLGRADVLEFDAFVSERVVEILADVRPSRVTFIAKSRGALFPSAMGKVPLPAEVGAIWVMPLLRLE